LTFALVGYHPKTLSIARTTETCPCRPACLSFARRATFRHAARRSCRSSCRNCRDGDACRNRHVPHRGLPMPNASSRRPGAKPAFGRAICCRRVRVVHRVIALRDSLLDDPTTARHISVAAIRHCVFSRGDKIGTI
jgi:hypothetical protein